jgi:hypothetical protein
VGVSAGLSTAGVGRLLAQVQKLKVTRNLDKLIPVKPLNPVAKFIKIMVFPREDVYLNEYGRKAIFKTGPFVGGTCIIFVGGGDFTTSAQPCDDNNCGEQDCGELICDGGNKCGTQNCGKQVMPGMANLFSPESIERIRTDPFIQGLFQELGVTTSAAMSMQLKTLIRQHR